VHKANGHGPLAGVRILEFEAIGPVPLAGMLLADMGAEVVQVCRPKRADQPWDDVGGAVLHRGRIQVEIDLKRNREAAFALVTGCDALLEGLRPGVMEKLGLGPQDCLAVNPKLVYGRMTGWGQTGPRAPRAGHDINYLGLTGALHALGTPGEPPPVPLNMIADYGGGAMFLVSGILAALLSARTSGEGQAVDVSMTDGVAALSSLFHAFRANGLWSDKRGNNLLDGGAPFYRCYACADGKYLAVGALEPAFYSQFVAGIGLSEAEFPQADRAGWPLMAEAFAAALRTKTRDDWAVLFDGTDACATPVLDWQEAQSDSHNVARRTFVERNHIVQPAPAPRFSCTPSAITEPLGMSIDEVLARWSAE
jgi:alpha-methylacyl-CoA racemase